MVGRMILSTQKFIHAYVNSRWRSTPSKVGMYACAYKTMWSTEQRVTLIFNQ